MKIKHGVLNSPVRDRTLFCKAFGVMSLRPNPVPMLKTTLKKRVLPEMATRNGMSDVSRLSIALSPLSRMNLDIV
jgi:hypothetical protein